MPCFWHFVLAFFRMKALSVRQPWASLIASGHKSIELRSWSTKYRGPILILAGSNVWRGSEHPIIGPLGVSLCLVNLIDVRPVVASDTEAACIVPPDGFDFAWVLANPREVRRVPVKGKLGLYSVDEALLKAIA